MAKRSLNRTRLYYLLTALLLIGAAVYWFSNLSVDPPMYYSGLGQSLSTDPAQYVYHARNKVLFGQFDPFNYPRWTVYEHSLVSLVAYIWFSIVGVSVSKANAVGVILSFGALILLLIGIGKNHKPWVLPALVFCYAVNITLLTYGRLSYLENGVAFFAAVLFLIYTRWGDRLWGVIAGAAVVAFAALTGKLFGALLLPALLAAIFFSTREHKWKEIFSAIGVYLVTSFLLALILYGSDFRATLGYFTEQSYGLRGFPEGLSSPLAFFEHLISYGFTTRMYYKTPELLMMVCSSMALLAFYLSSGERFSNLSRGTRFGLFWVGFGVLGLMPLNYSPLRYALIFIPAIFVTMFLLIDDLDTGKTLRTKRKGWIPLLILLFAFWVGLYQVFINVLYFNLLPSPVRMMTWTTFLGAIVLTVAVRYLLLGRNYFRLNHRVFMSFVIFLLVSTAVINTFRIRRHQFKERNYSIVESSDELPQILGPGAVVSGPYGPVLTLNNWDKSFIHLFGVTHVDSTLFDRYPITHIAVDEDNWRVAIKQYPQLRNQTPVTIFWIRDVAVNLYDISHLFHNPQANRYRKSEYERAVDYVVAQKHDTAMALLADVLRKFPYQKSAGLLQANLLQMVQQNDQALTLLLRLANAYPTDFYVQLQTARLMQEIAIVKKDNYMLNQARNIYAHAVDVDRYRGDLANSLYEKTMKQMQSGQGKVGP